MVGSSPERQPTRRLADRLATARRCNFVGRREELALVDAALAASDCSFSVVHVYGPGGVGKTALLSEFAHIAERAGVAVVTLDGRTVEPSPRGFLSALGLVLGSTKDVSPLETLAEPARRLFLIDAYEQLAVLDGWLRETLLPQLPESTLVVIAGRNPPDLAWRTDIGWAELTRVLALKDLSPDESRRYLTARGIHDEQQADVLAFTHGHPLGLALVADALLRGDSLSAFDPERQPDVVRLLIQRLVQDVPSARHRAALETCALALVTTEALLAAVVDANAAPELFTWLRQLSFIEEGPRGLVPHDLVRAALDAEARWRDIDGYRQVSRRTYAHLRSRLIVADEAERQRLQLDSLFAIRSSAINRAYFDWNAVEGVYAEPATLDDAEPIVRMVRDHEGDAAAHIARYWLGRQPAAFQVFRTVAGERFGFLALLAIQDATEADASADPAVAAAIRFVQHYGPPRPGEAVLQLRFWMHRDQYQAITAAINLTAGNVVTACTMHPSLAWNLVAMADPDFWIPHFTGINWPRAAEADYTVGGRHYGAFAHDWRIEPAVAWVGGNRTATMPHAAARHDAPPAVVLSRANFANAVRLALRDYRRPDRLATNPLLRSRVVRANAPASPSTATLQALLKESAAALAGDPRDVKFHRAITHTYFEPAATQEQAAELLGIPFNTYRYHLSRGADRIVDWLWRREVGGPGD